MLSWPKRIAGLVSLGGLRIPRWILNFGSALRADPKFKNQRRDSSPLKVKNVMKVLTLWRSQKGCDTRFKNFHYFSPLVARDWTHPTTLFLDHKDSIYSHCDHRPLFTTSGQFHVTAIFNVSQGRISISFLSFSTFTFSCK